jgi:AhpC/TSA family
MNPVLSWSASRVLPPKTMLPTRQLVPPLTLHVSDGRTVRAWDFKQKKNLVIAFLDADCASCEDFLRRLAERVGNLRAAQAVALAAFLEVPPLGLAETLPPEIIAGSDVSGRAVRAFLGEEALSSRGLGRRGIFVTDRYGELADQWPVAGHDFPPLGEILACLNQLEIACEECSSPHWSPEG